MIAEKPVTHNGDEVPDDAIVEIKGDISVSF